MLYLIMASAISSPQGPTIPGDCVCSQISVAHEAVFHGTVFINGGGSIDTTDPINTTNNINATGTITGGTLTDGTASLSNGTLTGLVAPTDPSDATNKDYVDSLIEGIHWKSPVHSSTTANITLSGLQTIDGVMLVDGDRVLVKNQTNGVENGFYNAAVGVWTRTTDMQSGVDASGFSTHVQEGTTNGDLSFVCTNNEGMGIVDTDILTWGQFSEILIPGDALSETVNVWNVNVDNTTITVNGGNNLEVSSTTYSTGTTGTDFNVSGSPVAPGGSVTLNIPDSSGTNRGLLTSTDWTTFNNKLNTTLTDTNILVGNGSNVATSVVMSGDATIANTGVLTLVDTSVTPSSYGSVTNVGTFTVDSKGRLTTASNVAISSTTYSTGTTGTDFNVSGSPVAPGGVVTLNIPDSSGTNRGLLTSTDWTTFNGKLNTTLTDTNILVGNGSNVATGVVMSGDATMANTGALTLADTIVTPGSYTNSDITVDSKGLLTSVVSTGVSWSTPVPLTIGATTTAPTKGTTTFDQITYATMGKTVIVNMQYLQTTSGTVGSGSYLYTLPGGLSFNTTINPTYTSSVVNPEWAATSLGVGKMGISGTNLADLQIMPYNATQFRISMRILSNSAGIHGSTTYSMSFSNLGFSINFIFTST